MMFNLSQIGRSCGKGMLLGLNGLGIVTAGILFAVALVDFKIIKKFGDDHAVGCSSGNLIIMAFSALIIFVSIFGSVGVIKGNVKVLYLYVGCLLFLMVFELLLGVFVAVNRYGLEFRFIEWIREDFFQNATDADEISFHNRLWSELQSEYECCGLNGPEDYPALVKTISLSCCDRAYRARTEHAQTQLYKACIADKTYYQAGCEDEILLSLREGADCLLGLAVTCFWIKVAGALLAMWIANNLKNEVQVYKQTVKY